MKRAILHFILTKIFRMEVLKLSTAEQQEINAYWCGLTNGSENAAGRT